MNTLTVDGNAMTAGEFTGANLEEILISLMEHPVVVNRVITKVMVNGDAYSEEVPHAALEVDREEIDTLELVTHTAEEMGLHFLEHGHYLVDMLRQVLPKIVEEFRLGDETEANEHFLGFLESLHLLISMLEQTQITIGLGEDLELQGEGSLNNYLETLGGILGTLVSLQEQSDWIYLADVLEFELDCSLGDLIDLLARLKKAGH